MLENKYDLHTLGLVNPNILYIYIYKCLLSKVFYMSLFIHLLFIYIMYKVISKHIMDATKKPIIYKYICGYRYSENFTRQT